MHRSSLPPSQRVPNLRKRPDLVMRPLWFRGRKYWIVKDPLALEYSRLREEEYFILELLDGRVSVEEIQRRFNERFAPLRLTPSRLQAFLGMLYRAGLLLSGAAGQGEELWQRGRGKLRRERWQTWTNPLAIRFRGIDPTPLLDILYPAVRWVFHPLCFAAWCLLALAALALVAVQFDTLQARLPQFETFFSPSNLLWLAVTLAGVKILHELGHAVACRHYGGECHELGFMLLVFTPCLYCNVSDAWLLPSKWRRVAISAAGIYVEVFLASACTFLWWFSQPGLLNTLALNTMSICSVGTVLLNGNPLLRYDGYYMLSDAIEVPNLWQESRRVVHGWLSRLVLGVDFAAEARQPEQSRWLLAAYGVASISYRVFVLIAICWFLLEVLEPLGLRAVAESIIFLVVVGVLLMPVTRAVEALRSPIRRRRISWGRLALAGVLGAAAIALLAAIPLPYRVKGPAVIQARDADHIYVKVAGRVVEALPVGTPVQAGDVVARLEQLELERKLHGLEAEVSQLRLQLENLESLRLNDPQIAELIPSVRQRLEGKRRELVRQREQVARLVLRAPRDGTVIAAPRRPRPAADRGEQLPTWWGNPLEEANRGALLQPDTLVCLVGDPGRLEAMAYVEQADVEFIQPGQRVRLLLPALPGTILTGTLEEVAEVDVEDVPAVLAESGRLPTRLDSTGRKRPVETLYQARIRLEASEQPVVIHACGRAKILVAPQSLARRMYRFLRRTFGEV